MRKVDLTAPLGTLKMELGLEQSGSGVKRQVSILMNPRFARELVVMLSGALAVYAKTYAAPPAGPLQPCTILSRQNDKIIRMTHYPTARAAPQSPSSRWDKCPQRP